MQVEHDLLPFVIVSTLDGKVRWTLRDGVEPLVGGGVRGRGRERGEGGEDYIVEPQGGGLYVFEVAEDEEGMGEGEGETKVRKLPLSVDQLYVMISNDSEQSGKRSQAKEAGCRIMVTQ